MERTDQHSDGDVRCCLHWMEASDTSLKLPGIVLSDMAPGTNQGTMGGQNDIEALIDGFPAERLSVGTHAYAFEQTQMHVEASEMMLFVDDTSSGGQVVGAYFDDDDGEV